MAANFECNTDAMRSAGQDILGYAQAFQTHYQQMLQHCNETKNHWSGEDNDKFVDNINKRTEPYERLHKNLVGAGNDMIEAADRYDQTEIGNLSKASGLRC